eukprot:5812075-Alexandrium_andersonii.AAC.1
MCPLRTVAATTRGKGSAPSGLPWPGRPSALAAGPGGPHWTTEWRRPGPAGPMRRRLPSPEPASWRETMGSARGARSPGSAPVPRPRLPRGIGRSSASLRPFG